MIEVEGLTRYYGKHPAVRGVSFRIQDHEIVGFLGLNGAGKSTTLKVLAGLLLPSSGKVTIDGVDVAHAPDSLRSHIGFLPEEPPLYRDMTVEDFITYCGQLKGLPGDQVRARLDTVLKQCNLADVRYRVIGELSLGYRKRVGIAQAIIHGPKLVILDEPISGLDPKQIHEMRDVIVGLKAHCTVLISSHILSEVSQTCDRILVLKGGEIVAEGTEDELARRAAGGHLVEMVLRGPVAKITEVIRAAGGDVQIMGDHAGLVTASVGAKDGPEAIVAALVQAGIGVRRVSEGASELEAIFLKLMKEGAA